MPASQPPASDLFALVREVLSAEIAPLLPPPQQFRLRMIDRVLEILSREQTLGASALAREQASLAALLADWPPLAEATGSGVAPSVDELATELCRRIRDGRVASDSPALLAHLRATLADGLRIDNPRWLPPQARAGEGA